MHIENEPAGSLNKLAEAAGTAAASMGELSKSLAELDAEWEARPEQRKARAERSAKEKRRAKAKRGRKQARSQKRKR